MTTRPSATSSTLTNEACLGPQPAAAAANKNPARRWFMTLPRARVARRTLGSPNARAWSAIYEGRDLFPGLRRPPVLRGGAASRATGGDVGAGGRGAAAAGAARG